MTTVIPDPQDTPMLTVEAAAHLMQIGRTKAYELARADQLPVKCVRIGGSYRIPTAPLLAVLGLDVIRNRT